jgi:FdhE protein
VAAEDHPGIWQRQVSRSTWDQRIRRAQELGQRCVSAAEILGFYAKLATCQKSLYEDFQSRSSGRGIPENWLESPPDTQFLLPRYPDFLGLIVSTAPELLAHAANELMQAGRERWAEVLDNYWQGGRCSAKERFFALAYLQPYAECVTDHVKASPRAGHPVCPLCGAAPVCGILRPEGHGARRSLVCSRCSSEWDFPRILCPACNEQHTQALSVFTAPEFDHVRIETCATCRHYLKTVDLTKDGLAVPIVDEIASLSLSLWAEEKGYSKLQPNLFGF